MFAAAFAAAGLDATMEPLAVPPERFAAEVERLRAAGMLGASVTLPHKLAAHALCDELAAPARAIGAVNCLELAGDRLIGHNTDADGFVDALGEAGFALRGARVIVLGAGGAARAVAYGVRTARAIEVVARRPEAVAWARAWPWRDDVLRECFARADLVVDCTPAGLAPATDTLDLPLDALPRGAWLASLVYHRTPAALERAKALGHSALDGRGMLVHQAGRAFRIWTGREPPLAIMRQALDASLVKSA